MSFIRPTSPDTTRDMELTASNLNAHQRQTDGLSFQSQATQEAQPVTSQPSHISGVLPATQVADKQRCFSRSAEPAQGILLNTAASELQRTTSFKSEHSVDDNVSTRSSEDDNCSRVSFDMHVKTEEDVCFPMPQAKARSSTFDFQELEKFSAANKLSSGTKANYYKPVYSYHSPTHRPFVPHSMIQAGDDYQYASYVENEKANAQMAFQDGVNENAAVKFGVARRNSFTMDRFFFFGADHEDTLKSADLSSLCQEDQSFENLFSSSSDGAWWLDCLDPSNEELSALSKAFGIHPLTTEDIRMRENREKVELFKNYYFVCYNTFEPDYEADDYLEPINVYMLVFKHAVISFHFSPIQHTVNVRRRIRQLREYVKVSSDWICYALIDDITDGFAPVLKEIEFETDVIEDSVFVAREQDFGPMLLRIGQARKKVMTMLRLLSSKEGVIKMFTKRCNGEHGSAPGSEISLYLGDIQDHILTMHQSLSQCEKIFSRSHSNYLAQLQVESVNSNNRVTKVLGRITLIGTILVPLNLVTGVFGMNVQVPGQQDESLKWFFGIIGFIVAVIILFSLLANKWMGEAEADSSSSSSSEKTSRPTLPSFFDRKERVASIRSVRS